MSNRFFTTVLSTSAFFLLFFVFIFQPNVSLLRVIRPPGQIHGASSIALLPYSIRIEGNKSIAFETVSLPIDALLGKDVLKLTYNLHGVCLLPGKSSEIALLDDLSIEYTVELSQYGETCYDGIQSVDIPISHFSGSVPLENIQSLQFTFWYPTQFTVDIENVIAYFSGGSVLGLSTDPPKPMHNKTFPNITPIRPSPYAAYHVGE